MRQDWFDCPCRERTVNYDVHCSKLTLVNVTHIGTNSTKDVIDNAVAVMI